MTSNCSFTGRLYTKYYGHYFLLLDNETELALFHSKHVPVMEVCIHRDIQYYAELLDFLNTVLPEIGFTSAFVYKDEESSFIRASLKNTHVCKHSLDILGNHCKDYLLEATSGCDEEGTPSFTLDVIIPIN